jgi:hypothetical protein
VRRIAQFILFFASLFLFLLAQSNLFTRQGEKREKREKNEDEILSFSSRLLSIIILKDYFYESIVCIYQTHSNTLPFSFVFLDARKEVVW